MPRGHSTCRTFFKSNRESSEKADIFPRLFTSLISRDRSRGGESRSYCCFSDLISVPVNVEDERRGGDVYDDRDDPDDYDSGDGGRRNLSHGSSLRKTVVANGGPPGRYCSTISLMFDVSVSDKCVYLQPSYLFVALGHALMVN